MAAKKKAPTKSAATGAGASHRPSLKVASFNVNGVRSRLPHLLDWLT